MIPASSRRIYGRAIIVGWAFGFFLVYLGSPVSHWRTQFVGPMEAGLSLFAEQRPLFDEQLGALSANRGMKRLSTGNAWDQFAVSRTERRPIGGRTRIA